MVLEDDETNGQGTTDWTTGHAIRPRWECKLGDVFNRLLVAG